MYRTTCDTPTCRNVLFSVYRFHGAVETKCSSCRRIVTYRFGTADTPTVDVRCTNSFKGQDLGGWCGQLIARITHDTYGQFGYRCPRCKDQKTIKIQTPVLVST